MQPLSPKVGHASSRDWLYPALILINTLNGPGFVVLAEAGRQAGALGAVLLVAAFALLATFSARRACAVAREAEAHKIEGGGADLAGPCRTLWGGRGARVAAAACATALLACAVAQIVPVRPARRRAGGGAGRRRCGVVVRLPSLELTGKAALFYAGCRPAAEPLPAPALEASVGVLLTLALARLARRAEGPRTQGVGFACFCLGAWRWGAYLRRETVADRAVAWLGPSPLAAAPAVCFNFACVLAVPPLALRGRAEAAARGAGAACLFMALAYAAVAVLGAGGAPTAPSADALLATGRASDLAAVFFLFVSQLAAIPTYLAGADGLIKAHLVAADARRADALAAAAAWLSPSPRTSPSCSSRSSTGRPSSCWASRTSRCRSCWTWPGATPGWRATGVDFRAAVAVAARQDRRSRSRAWRPSSPRGRRAVVRRRGRRRRGRGEPPAGGADAAVGLRWPPPTWFTQLCSTFFYSARGLYPAASRWPCASSPAR